MSDVENLVAVAFSLQETCRTCLQNIQDPESLFSISGDSQPLININGRISSVNLLEELRFLRLRVCNYCLIPLFCFTFFMFNSRFPPTMVCHSRFVRNVFGVSLQRYIFVKIVIVHKICLSNSFEMIRK